MADLTTHQLAAQLLAGPDVPALIEVSDPTYWVVVSSVTYVPDHGLWFCSDEPDEGRGPAVRLE